MEPLIHSFMSRNSFHVMYKIIPFLGVLKSRRGKPNSENQNSQCLSANDVRIEGDDSKCRGKVQISWCVEGAVARHLSDDIPKV